MYDLVVIGAGFWGTATSVMAVQRGVNCLLLDSYEEMSSSRAATGQVIRDWYTRKKKGTITRKLPDGWATQDVDDSIAWLEEHCGLTKTGRVLYNYVGHPTAPLRSEKPDSYLLNHPDDLLGLATPTRAKVHALVPIGAGWEVYTSRGTYATKTVVVAAGVWTDTILSASNLPTVGVVPLLGRAVLLDTAYTPEALFTEILQRPYQHYNLRRFETYLRVGDTTEQQRNPQAYASLLAAATTMIGSFNLVSNVEGLRPVTKEFVLHEVAPKLVVATGGHRVGLGLSALIAKKALQNLHLY